MNPPARSRRSAPPRRRGHPLPRGLALLAALAAFAAASAAAAQAPASPGSFASAFFYAATAEADGSQRIEWLGTLLIWLLLLLSMVNIGLISQLFVANRRLALLPPGTAERLREMLQGGKYREAMALAEQDPSDLARIVRICLGQASFGFGAMLRALEQVSEETTTERLRRVESLNIIGQVSPMIGLFGTVYGMIVAFRSIAESGGNADPVLLAGGIGTALVTTFWGLLVAIPALAAYAMVRNRIDSLATETSLEAQSLIEQFRPKPRSEGEAPRGAAP